jgi:lauroyl/myristoyl acyltransferase
MESDLDLRSSLQELSRKNLSWPEKAAMMPFARGTLGVQPPNEDAWYRSACWGYYATRLLQIFLGNGKQEKIIELLDPKSDWSALDQALGLGNGVILLSAHLSAGRIPALAALQNGYRVKQITRHRHEHAGRKEDDYIYVSTDAEMKVSLIKSLRHLKSGGIIAASGTGGYGVQHLSANFLGHPLRVFLGISEIARLSRAPTLWANCSWTAPDRLKLILEPLPMPTGEGEEWHKQYFGQFLQKLGLHIRQYPADLGFSFGYWTLGKGLPWYQPQVL